MEYTLRRWRMADAETLARYANNRRIAQNLRDAFPHPYGPEDARTYIQSCLESDASKKWLYAIDIEGEAAGSVGVFRGEDVYRRGAELGYWLAEPFWGKGIMTRAVRELCGAVFANSDILRIYAEPFACNTGSRRVLEKAGFTLEAVLRKNVVKCGQVLDSCLYALLAEDLS